MQIVNQLAAIGIAVAFAVMGTLFILKPVDLVIGLRVSENDETIGLDATQHGETAYIFEPDSIHVFGGTILTKKGIYAEIVTSSLILETK